MIKKIIAFSFIAWAVITISSASPAKAGFIIPAGAQDLTEIRVTPKTRNDTFNYCGYNFSYQQLMVIPGVGAVWVPVEFVYPRGLRTAYLKGTCENGDKVYEFIDFD